MFRFYLKWKDYHRDKTYNILFNNCDIIEKQNRIKVEILSFGNFALLKLFQVFEFIFWRIDFVKDCFRRKK
jgi:hypothetical protein